MSDTLVRSPPLPDAPYRGIEPFRFVDQMIFAARDEETWELLSKVTLYRATLLYGESGTGKSSLINAGLVPQALNDNYVANRLRIQPFADREIRVERMIQHDGSNPVYLPCSFSPVSKTDKDATDFGSFELSLEAFLQQLSQGRWTPRTDHATTYALGQGFAFDSVSPRPLLIFDQFEEFITLFEEAPRREPSDHSTGSRERLNQIQWLILDALVRLIRDTTLPVKLVFVFREDFLAKLNPLFDFCPELVDQSLRLVSPHVSALPQIIRQPFSNEELRIHFRKAGESGSELTERMAEQIAADLSQRSENKLINLSELQIVCLLLWRSTEPERLYRQKRVEGLLEDYGSGVVGRFSSDLQDKAVALLAEMLTGSNTRNIVSEADLKVTAMRERMNEDQVDRMLNELCRNQIVRRERHRELYFYELTSEYLIPWINKLAAQREVDRLKEQAFEERRRAMELQRTLRKVYWLQTLLIAVGIGALVLMLITTYFANKSANAERARATATKQAYESEQRQFRAEGRAQLAEEQRKKLAVLISPLITTSDDEAKLDAISKIRAWRQEGNLPGEFLILLLAAQQQSENLIVKRAALDALAEAAQADPEISKSIDLAAEADPDLAAKLPLRFNIYIADENQRATAEKISNALRQRGYVVPSTSSVVTNSPKWDNELRYFNEPERGQQKPIEVIGLLKNVTRSNWRAAYNSKYSNSPRGRPGQVELWLAVPAGHLDIDFVDEEGKPITGVAFSLHFELITGPGVTFNSRYPGVTVPQGDYEVSISVPGYKVLKQPLKIKGGQAVEWTGIKLTRDRPTLN